MVRKGIYVNGKEIIARYVGDKLVWRKETAFDLVMAITNQQWIQYTSFTGFGMQCNFTIGHAESNKAPDINYSDKVKVVIDGKTHTNVSVEVTKINHRRYYSVNAMIRFYNKQELDYALQKPITLVQIYRQVQ